MGQVVAPPAPMGQRHGMTSDISFRGSTQIRKLRDTFSTKRRVQDMYVRVCVCAHACGGVCGGACTGMQVCGWSMLGLCRP